MRDLTRLERALQTLEVGAPDPLLLTRLGRAFPLDEIGDGMGYEGEAGAKAVLVP